MLRLGRCWIIALSGLIGCLGAELRAQAPAVAVAESLFAALGRRDWPAATALIDSAHAASFRRTQLGILAATRTVRAEMSSERGSGGLAVVSPELEPETVEEAVAQQRDRRVGLFPGYVTLGEIAALSPAAFLAQFLARTDAQLEHLSRPRRVVASAAENDSVAHVLYRGADPFRHRQAEPPDSARPVTVLTIMRRRGAWRALLNEDLVPLSAFILESREDEAERPR